MKKIPNDDSFERLTSHDLKLADAPFKLMLPRQLVSGMQNAWDNSFPNRQSQEHGGILVRNDDRSYKWKAGKAGTSGSFIANDDEVDKDETLVAIGHTHPYDEKEGGYTNVSFSGSDLAIVVYQKPVVNIVQSGKGLFVIARSAEFNQLIKNLDAAGKNSLFREIQATWYQIFLTHSGKLPERANAATEATTAKYHLVYYKGRGHTLTRLKPTGEDN